MKRLSLEHVVRLPGDGANGAGVRPPLLLLLHGVGSNEQSMAALAPEFDPRFVVISARSPVVLGPNAFGWFHVSFTPSGPVIDASEAAEGWAAMARFIDEAADAYDVDAARVYVGGFSQGGIMSLATLLTAPERIAGAVCMSGRLLPEVLPHTADPERLRGKPVLIVHGLQDEKLGIHFARSAREQLRRFPLDLAYEEFAMGHNVTRESLETVRVWLAARLDASVTT